MPVLHVVPDDEFALALVRIPGELAIAPMLAIARFHAFRAHPIMRSVRCLCHWTLRTATISRCCLRRAELAARGPKRVDYPHPRHVHLPYQQYVVSAAF